MEDNLRYPIGKFKAQATYTATEIATNIDRIATLPQKVEELFKTLSVSQLGKSYRSNGWTARQIIHHIPDSHLNAYIRFKWTLTENTPTIKAYDEKAWALTPEINDDPSLAIELLKALHSKWIALLQKLSEEDLQKSFIHPESGNQISLDQMIALYAWHGEHHLGHLKIIQQLLQ